MTTTDTPTLDQAQLIARLAEALVAQPAPAADAGAFTLPVLSGGTWTDDLPLSRTELYGNDERC